MNVNINYLGKKKDKAIYSIDGYPKIYGSASIISFWLSDFKLRKITVKNDNSNELYELKQKNIIMRILLATVLKPFDSYMSPPFNFYINGKKYGRFREPLAVIDDVEYILEYKNKKYNVSFHNLCTVAVLIDNVQIMKLTYKKNKVKDAINYFVEYDSKYINDIMFIIIVTIYINYAMDPKNIFNNRSFSRRTELHPERIEWKPNDNF